MKTRESGMPSGKMWEEFVDPPSVLTKLGLTSNCRDVVEFGCGYGTFTIPAAQIILGTIHALDIDPQMIEETNSNVRSSKVSNVNLMLRDFVTDGTGMPDASIDFVMLFNILHAVEREAMLGEAWRIWGKIDQFTSDHMESRVLDPRICNLLVLDEYSCLAPLAYWDRSSNASQQVFHSTPKPSMLLVALRPAQLREEC